MEHATYDEQVPGPVGMDTEASIEPHTEGAETAVTSGGHVEPGQPGQGPGAHYHIAMVDASGSNRANAGPAIRKMAELMTTAGDGAMPECQLLGLFNGGLHWLTDNPALIFSSLPVLPPEAADIEEIGIRMAGKEPLPTAVLEKLGDMRIASAAFTNALSSSQTALNAAVVLAMGCATAQLQATSGLVWVHIMTDGKETVNTGMFDLAYERLQQARATGRVKITFYLAQGLVDTFNFMKMWDISENEVLVWSHDPVYAGNAISGMVQLARASSMLSRQNTMQIDIPTVVRQASVSQASVSQASVSQAAPALTRQPAVAS